jgi:predicted TPR repeat methyltransferase
MNAQRRLNRLLQLPDIRLSSWLDVGCATGDFLVVASAVVKDPYGVEISDHAWAVAKSRGLQVMLGDFLEVEFTASRFDVITMWDYIEHVCDPMANLAKARNLLRAGGYLAISTGDIGSRIARLMGKRWHLMIPPKHLYFFSERTLADMLLKSGFSVITISRDGKYVPVDFIAWKATFLLMPSLARYVVSLARKIGLGRIAPYINLGDIMTVVARKQG